MKRKNKRKKKRKRKKKKRKMRREKKRKKKKRNNNRSSSCRPQQNQTTGCNKGLITNLGTVSRNTNIHPFVGHAGPAKNLKIKIYRTIILPVVCMVVKLGC